MRRDERLPSVILSEAKDLAPGNEILRFAQDDKLVFSILTAFWSPFLGLLNEYVGVNSPFLPPRSGVAAFQLINLTPIIQSLGFAYGIKYFSYMCYNRYIGYKCYICFTTLITRKTSKQCNPQ